MPVEIFFTGISTAGTVEEIAEFWDSHSLSDYGDQTKEVEFEIRAKHRRCTTLDPEIYAQVEVQARTHRPLFLWLMPFLPGTKYGQDLWD